MAACNACNLLRADIFNAVYWRIRKLFDRMVRGMTPTEIETRLGAVLERLE